MNFFKKKLAKAVSSISYRQEPARLERLEPRILLSADPILVPTLSTSDTERVVAQADLEINLAALQRQLRGEDPDAIKLDRDGPGAGQIAQLVSGAGDTLQINEQLAELTFVLGDGNNQAMLTQEEDGFFKLSGTDMFSVLFRAPTGSLTISGGEGIDAITLNDLDLGEASLRIDGESITLAANSTVQTLGDVSLLAVDQVSGAVTSETDGSILNAYVGIAGNLLAAGDVRLGATAQSNFSQTADDGGSLQALADLGTFDLSAQAHIEIDGAAKISAGTLQLSAATDTTLSVTSSGAEALNFVVDLTQSALTEVAAGAQLLTTQTEAVPALVLEALDRAALDVNITVKDAAIPASASMLDTVGSELALSRSAQVRVGDDSGASTVLSAAGAGEVLAYSASLGHAKQMVESDRTGRASTTLSETAQTVLQGVTLTGGQADVMAGAHSAYSAAAKQAIQTLSGDVLARLVDGSATLEGALRLLAVDTTAMESQATAWILDGLEMPSGTMEALMAVNRMDRDVDAAVVGAQVTAADVLVLAHAAAVLQVETSSLAVSADESGVNRFKLLGALAANEVQGNVRATASDASLLTTGSSTGDIWVQATQALEARAQGEGAMAQGSGQGDAPSGAHVASNLVGWALPSLDLSDLDPWLTLDPTNDTAMLVEAEVTGSLVQAERDLVVSARDLSLLASELANTPAAAGAAALALGASHVLSTNRSRVLTTAQARYQEGVDQPTGQILGSGRDFMLRAQQSSSISADVVMNRGLSGADDSAPVVGGVTAFNVVQHGASTALDSVFLRTEGNLALAAEEQSAVRAETRGDLRLVALGDADAVVSPTLAARDALVVHNFYTGDVASVANASTLQSAGNVSVLAANDAEFQADHRMQALGEGEVAALVAANSAGWRDQPLLDFGRDALVAASDQAAALQVAANLTDSSLEADGDLDVLARFAVESVAGAAAEDRAPLSGGRIATLFVGNLIDADVGSVLEQSAHETYTLGGNVTILAQQDGRLSAQGDTGQAPSAVESYLVRNVLDVPVDVRVTATSLVAAGSVNVLAEDRAEVIARAEGELDTLLPTLVTPALLQDALRGAVMVINSGLPQARVAISGSDLTAGGALSLRALEALDVTAHNQARQQSGADGVGSMEAWNVFGWVAPAVATGSVDDALRGDFGSQLEPDAGAEVRWEGSALEAEGALTVLAEGLSTYAATVDALPITSIATGEAEAQHASLAIANSSVSARHRVLLERSDQVPGTTDSLSRASISSGADLHIAAKDRTAADALVAFSSLVQVNRVDSAIAQTWVEGHTEIALFEAAVDSAGAVKIAGEAVRAQSSELRGATQLMETQRPLRDAPAGARAVNVAAGDVYVDVDGSPVTAVGDVEITASATNQAAAHHDLAIRVDSSEFPIDENDPADWSLAANVVGLSAADPTSMETLLNTDLDAANAADVAVYLSDSDVVAGGGHFRCGRAGRCRHARGPLQRAYWGIGRLPAKAVAPGLPSGHQSG